MAGFFEAPAEGRIDATALVGECLSQRSRGLLVDRAALPAAFFDLSSGIAGELVQKLTNYGIRMAAVVPDLDGQPPRFREFAREANAGRQFRFCATRQEAIDWLAAAGA
jgi:Domain of unknown function (DUF4180)